MKELQNQKNTLNFKDYYCSLSEKDKLILRNKIIDEFEFSLATFYYKLNNNNYKKLELQELQKIISDFNNNKGIQPNDN